MYLLLWTNFHGSGSLPLILLPLDMCLEVRSLENQPVLFLIRGYLPIPFDNRRAPLHSLLQSGLSSLPAGILAEVKCCILGMLACISLMTLELFHFPLLLKRFTLILSKKIYSYFVYFYIGSSIDLLIWVSHTFLLLTLCQTHYSEVLSLNV